METIIKKGVNLKDFAIGLGCAAFGVFLIVEGFVYNYTLSIRSFVLPQCTIYVLGVIFFVVGLIVFFLSLRSKKCSSCNKVLEEGEVYFPLDQQERVKEAVEGLNAALLKDIPVKGESNNSVILRLNFCPMCLETCEINLLKEEGYEETEIIPLRVVKDPGIKGFVDFVDEFGTGEDD